MHEDTWKFKLARRTVERRISYRNRYTNNENTDRFIYTSQCRSGGSFTGREEGRHTALCTSKIFARQVSLVRTGEQEICILRQNLACKRKIFPFFFFIPLFIRPRDTRSWSSLFDESPALRVARIHFPTLSTKKGRRENWVWNFRERLS